MICLGNLTVEQIERDFDFEFNDEERAFLKAKHHKLASFEDRKSGWHMFDMPRRLEVSPDETGENVINTFKRHNEDIKGCISVAYAWKRDE